MNGTTITVTTAGELTAALDTVEPGQAIAHEDGLYISDQFEAAVDGTAFHHTDRLARCDPHHRRRGIRLRPAHNR